MTPYARLSKNLLKIRKCQRSSVLKKHVNLLMKTLTLKSFRTSKQYIKCVEINDKANTNEAKSEYF